MPHSIHHHTFNLSLSSELINSISDSKLNLAEIRDDSTEPAHAQAGPTQAELPEEPITSAHAAQAALESNDIEAEDDDPLPLSDDAVLEAMGYTDVLDQAIGRSIERGHHGLKRDVWLTAMMPRQFVELAESLKMKL